METRQRVTWPKPHRERTVPLVLKHDNCLYHVPTVSLKKGFHPITFAGFQQTSPGPLFVRRAFHLDLHITKEIAVYHKNNLLMTDKIGLFRQPIFVMHC